MVARETNASRERTAASVGPEAPTSWGAPAARSVYLFGRAVGVTSLVAFVSLHVQLMGLYGADGVLPLAPRLARIAASDAPSLLFVTGASDTALHAVALLGELASLAVALGALPGVGALVAFVAYLSFVSVGWPFLPLQWDTLLLETLLLVALASPWDRAWISPRALPVPRVLPRVAIAFLACRLHVASGLVKILSGDPHWADLSALDFHFETQPLPTPLSPVVHALPHGAHAAMVLSVYALEIVLPFAAIARRARPWVLAGLVGLQLSIALTGNYGFFNVLSAIVALPLLDDAQLHALAPRLAARLLVEGPREQAAPQRRPSVTTVLATASLVLGALDLHATLGGVLPDGLADARAVVARLHLTSEYGPFGVMTTVRREIVLEVSEDAEHWQEVRLPYQPGPLARRPPVVPFHMPRVDWMMWFAALGEPEDAPWLLWLERGVLEDRAAVRGLLDDVPGEGRLRFVRAVRHRYAFDPTGTATWVRTEREPFGATLSRRR